MTSRVTITAFYWVVVAASVIASIMALQFLGVMWPQISAYAAPPSKLLAAIFIVLPMLNVVLLRLSYPNRLGAALAVMAAQAGILFI